MDSVYRGNGTAEREAIDLAGSKPGTFTPFRGKTATDFTGDDQHLLVLNDLAARATDPEDKAAIQAKALEVAMERLGSKTVVDATAESLSSSDSKKAVSSPKVPSDVSHPVVSKKVAVGSKSLLDKIVSFFKSILIFLDPSQMLVHFGSVDPYYH